MENFSIVTRKLISQKFFSVLTLYGDKLFTARHYIPLPSNLNRNTNGKQLVYYLAIHIIVRPYLVCKLFVKSSVLELPTTRVYKPGTDSTKSMNTFAKDKFEQFASRAVIVHVSAFTKYDLYTLSLFQEICGLQKTNSNQSP